MKNILATAPRDEQGRLLAPNGKPSNLTERQYAQVRTKAFIDWFGDWVNDPKNASKVVDENGEPLVVYHGISKEDINTFRTNNGWLHGIYFSKNKKIAEAYAKDNIIKPVFLNVKNLKKIPSEKSQDVIILSGNKVPLELAFKMQTEEVIPIIKEHYDGVVMYTQGGLDHEIVVYNSNQIKSATDNIGTFSKENNNIYYRKVPTLKETYGVKVTSFNSYSTEIKNDLQLIGWTEDKFNSISQQERD